MTALSSSSFQKIRTNTAVMPSCHPFLKSAWKHQHLMQSSLPSLDSHFVTDLFTCVIVSLPLCDVICIALFSSNFQAVSVSDTTANTSESSVPWTPHSRPLSFPWCLMSDDRWSVMASMCGLKHSNFCGWLRDVGPLMSTTAVCVRFASITAAEHLKHTVSLMLHQAWMLLLNSRLNKMF